MKKIIRIILLAICLGVSCFSGYKIYQYISEEKANKELNNALIEKAVIENPKMNVMEEGSQTANRLPINIDFSVLKQENEEIVGWIYAENTPINYPVLQSFDNEFYLHRLTNGEYNVAGSIFMDYRNNANLEDNNTILYGHNMKNDTMFGSLQEYKDQAYFEEHQDMYYFTPEHSYLVKLFAGFTISVNSDIYNMEIMGLETIQNFKEKSDFDADVTIGKEDKIITLSTCAYEYDGARYVVIGILQEILSSKN